MTKIIIPMARLATVNVTHEDVEPISGNMAMARATGSSSGTISRGGSGRASSAVVSVIDGSPG